MTDSQAVNVLILFAFLSPGVLRKRRMSLYIGTKYKDILLHHN